MWKAWKTSLVLVLLVALILNTVSPVFAAEWDEVSNHQPPSAYAREGINTYTRGQWEDFYINYNGDQLGTDGAVWVGSLYPVDVFDKRVGQDSFGYAAVSNNNLNSPYQSQNRDSIRAFLEGFQIPYDNSGSGYYLVSMDFLENVGFIPVSVGGTVVYVRDTWPLSSTIRDVPLNVTVEDIPGDQVRQWNAPPPGDIGQKQIECIHNEPPGFIGEAYYLKEATSTYHLWQKARVYVNDSRGPVNLTQEEAAAYMDNNISSGVGYPNSFYPTQTWRGQSGVSFPYNIFVAEVKKVGDSGDYADYDWSVVNQTPLWLKNITVRVYTRGKSTGKWNLVEVYQNIDIPPAKKGGGLLCNPQNNNVVVTANGFWTVAQPAHFTRVPKPSEDYDVIVTANVNLNVQSGQVSAPMPTIDTGMYGVLCGKTLQMRSPGLPPGETKELLNRASSILGVTLPQGYNDNVASSSDTGVTPPPPGGGDVAGPNDLAVTAMQVVDASNGQPVSSAQPNQILKIKASFKSSFDVAGWARVRFYKYQPEYKRLDQVGDTINVYVEPRGSFNKESITFNTGAGQYKFIAAIDYYNNGNDPSTGWQAEKFDGKHEEKTYDNNKKDWDLTGSEPEPWRPHPVEYSQTAWYPPKYWKEVAKYEDYTEPIYGWKKVPYEKEKPGDGKVRVRLVE